MQSRKIPQSIPKNKYEILIKLQENPLAPALQIAREINNRYPDKERKLSPTTVINSINWLQENRSFTEVHPVLNDSALELKLVDIFVKPSSYRSIRNLEMRKGGSCNFPHPYISYHARINGHHEGLYFQFRIPDSSMNMLEIFFEELIKRKHVDKFEIFQRNPSVRAFTTADLNAWIPEEYRWDFDGESWIAGFDEEKYSFTNKPLHDSILEKLDFIDIILLAELSKNARRKNKEIGKAAMDALRASTPGNFFPSEISTQDLSRRLKRLKEEAIERMRLFLNWRTFDIYNTVFFTCKASEKKTRAIAAYLEQGLQQFPFESVLSALKDGFFWYMRAPSNVISYVTEFLWQKVDSREMSLIDYRSSELYEFWPDTYDRETKKWKTSREFMVDEPLKYIDNYKL